MSIEDGDEKTRLIERWKFSPEERASALANFSFDMDALRKRFQNGDDWSTMLGAHLYFDHVITTMLEEELAKPGRIELDRVSFSAKLDLCADMGLIDDQTTGLLRAINKMRNSLAHDLSYQISEKDVEKLYRLASSEERRSIDEQKIVYSKDAPLFRILSTVLVFLDFRRQWIAERRTKRREAFENARAVLDRIDGVVGSATRNN